MRTGNSFTPGNNEGDLLGAFASAGRVGAQTIDEDVQGVLGKLAGVASGGRQASESSRKFARR